MLDVFLGELLLLTWPASLMKFLQGIQMFSICSTVFLTPATDARARLACYLVARCQRL